MGRGRRTLACAFGGNFALRRVAAKKLDVLGKIILASNFSSQDLKLSHLRVFFYYFVDVFTALGFVKSVRSINKNMSAGAAAVLRCVEFEIYGRVQGVWMRKHTVLAAKHFGLTGNCYNTNNTQRHANQQSVSQKCTATVRGEACGSNDNVQQFLLWASGGWKESLPVNFGPGGIEQPAPVAELYILDCVVAVRRHTRSWLELMRATYLQTPKSKKAHSQLSNSAVSDAANAHLVRSRKHDHEFHRC